jgi:hypothetical protein
VVEMLPLPSVGWTSGKLALRSIACDMGPVPF